MQLREIWRCVAYWACTAPRLRWYALGEGMTGSRTNPALLQRICAITAWRRPTTHNLAADLPASANQRAPGRPSVKTVRPRYAAGAPS